jgi:hypothetical protein
MAFFFIFNLASVPFDALTGLWYLECEIDGIETCNLKEQREINS